MANRNEQFQQQVARIEQTEGDFYALLIFQILVNLMPDKSPKQIADEVLRAYEHLMENPEEAYNG